DPNVPNEDVPEEDPYHLLDYDEEEDPEMDIEEEEPEEDPVEEPEPLAGYGDQFDAYPNPQPGNINGWVDDDDNVEEEEDDENEDVYIEEDDDAEIIFPYEVQGDQTPPPRDESSDSEFKAEETDDELEVEEAGVKPEVEEAGTEPEVEEAGDEPDAEGADVELEVEEPDGAPKATIGTEREILHHDLSGVEETLGKVVKRLKVLKSEENATLRKKLAEKENERFYLEMVRKGAVPKPPYDDEGSKCPRKMPKKSEEDEGPSNPRGPLMIMPPKPMSEARIREIIHDQFATSMNEFMANINSGVGGSGGASGSGGAGGSGGTGGNADGTSVRGARPTVPELTGCTYVTFIKYDPLPFNGTEGAVAMGIEAANNTPWSEVRKWMTEEFYPRTVIQRMEKEFYNLWMKGMDIDGYTNRFHELALLCSRIMEPEAVKVEQYIRGLTKSIRGDVTSSQPATINDAVRLAYQLAGQLIQDKVDEATEGEKRKGEGDRGSRGDCWKCTKCGKLGHKTERCRILEMCCCNCHEKGHRKKDCPKLGRNGQGGNNRRGVYQLGDVNAQENPRVVTGTFLLNNHYATALFDSGTDKSFVSTKFSTLINIKPVEIDTSYEVELADGKIVSTNNILKGCTLNLLNHSFPIDLIVIELGSFDVIIRMDWLSKNDAAILCGEKKVRIPLKNKALIIEGDKNQSRLKIISCIKARKYIENDCKLFLAQVTGTVSKEKQVEFCIDLVPGATPVARAPYHLAPSELKELSEQLKELSEKGFIRPSSSPWGAPVLFVKKKDGSFRM
nr:hypothetical protein [Tanacetum cinerariifolium]